MAKLPSGINAVVSLLHQAVKEDLWHHSDEVEHEHCGGKAKWSGIAHGHVVTCQKCNFSQYLALLKDHDKIPGWRRRQKLGTTTGVTYGFPNGQPTSVSASGSRVVEKVCECGAGATGIKPYSTGHAHYCPVKKEA